MATLPTRIRQHIRDHITADTAPLTTKTSTLSSLLGYPISLDPEWGMLWTVLQPYYPDPSTFIPSIANTLITWCDAFTAWLENDDNSEAVERMLDALKGAQALRLIIEIAPTSQLPATRWRSSKAAFVVALPKAHMGATQTVLAGFMSDLLSLFTMSPSMLPAQSPEFPSTAAAVPEDPEAWAELLVDPPVSKPVVAGVKQVQGDDVLPNVATLERPEELTKRPPYWLVVRQEGKGRVEVQCSHQGSLLVLEGYLKKWIRHATDLVHRPPVVEIRLKESSFGLGLLYDTLVLEAGRGREIGATMVLVLVESILGYDPVAGSGSAGSVWEFKRTRGFK